MRLEPTCELELDEQVELQHFSETVLKTANMQTDEICDLRYLTACWQSLQASHTNTTLFDPHTDLGQSYSIELI